MRVELYGIYIWVVHSVYLGEQLGNLGEPNENPMGTWWEHIGSKGKNKKSLYLTWALSWWFERQPLWTTFFQKELLDCWSESEMISFGLKKSWFTNSVVKLNFQMPNFEVFLEMLPNCKKCMYIVSFWEKILIYYQQLITYCSSLILSRWLGRSCLCGSLS